MTSAIVIKRPVITEKSSRLREENRYVVEVDTRASKGEIKIAIEKMFNVKVTSVHTLRVHGKYRRRMGPMGGYTPDRKKAIVRVKEGQQINWDQLA